MNLKRISASCFCLLLAGQMTLSAQNVSFSSNKVTLKSAFEKIEKESKYKIAYNSSQLDANRSVTLTKKSDDVFGMLNQLLKGTNFTYEMEGNYIVIKPQQKAKSQAHGKKIKVRGVVKDETGEPVIGATVMEKGTTTNGVVTDIDGNYTIEIPADGILAVSYIGCKDQDIKVNGREVINVNLADDNKVLSEVVVVGYGTQKKANLTGAVSMVTTQHPYRRKDSEGKASISYNGRVGWKQNTTSTDFIHTGYDHVNLVNQFYEAYQGKLMANYTDKDLQMLYDRRNDKTENPDRPWTVVGDDGKYYYYGNFDWYDYFYRKTRPEQEHNVSVTGGNDK